MEDNKIFCSVLISGKVIVYAIEGHSATSRTWVAPCELSYTPYDSQHMAMTLKRLDQFNADDRVPKPEPTQILTTYKPDEHLIQRYKEVVEKLQESEEMPEVPLNGAMQ